MLLLSIMGLLSLAASHLATPTTTSTEDSGIFLSAWTAAIKAMASGQAPRADDIYAHDLLQTLARESHNPTIRLMAQTALGKVEPEVKKWVEILAQEERNKQRGRQYEKEKSIV